VEVYKKLRQYGEIGITHVFNPAFSIDDNKENIEAANHANYFELYWYYDPILKGEYPEYVSNILKERDVFPDMTQDELDILKRNADSNDFIGLNYYQPMRVAKNRDTTSNEKQSPTGAAGGVYFDGYFRSVVMEDKKYTKWGWEISPEAFVDGTKLLKERYGNVKLYVTENGLGDIDPIIEDEVLDVPRAKFIEEHLRAIKKAISEGVNLKGYYAWSVIDLLSWLNGYKKQYGFIYVDHKNNLERKKKYSYYWYKNVIETRGEKL
jgi:6-phospho-beta-glucosidase